MTSEFKPHHHHYMDGLVVSFCEDKCFYKSTPDFCTDAHEGEEYVGGQSFADLRKAAAEPEPEILECGNCRTKLKNPHPDRDHWDGACGHCKSQLAYSINRGEKIFITFCRKRTVLRLGGNEDPVILEPGDTFTTETGVTIRG